ncbi:amidohydrolase [Rhodanobacter sp. AS-Z3]|uniref:amidohydrolase n=1 Tax=Rhodanobacter sp. AS-Z3 TaxID=3031330 RepID=UPI002479C900|nr:amidohydrolase [Rhodanobacter sp. AS-Z3]WEN13597.1 amidohydrolase [Rhodanobacter sp. AS-Z3]
MNRSLRFSLLALLVLAPATQAADLLVSNVNGYTLDSSGKLQHFQALLVDQGKVVATGTTADLSKRAGDAKVVDGHGQTLLPGLIDAHGHVLELGYALNSVDLSGTKSLAEALAVVKAYAAAHPEAKWIRGGGWNQEIWKLGRFPTAKELDAVVSDRPVWLSRIDGHAAWANSAAIKLAGVTKATNDPSGGRIERDAEGNPTGVFVDGASSLVDAVAPALTTQDRVAALDSALAEMASVGLTGVSDAGIDLATYQLYRQYADEHKLTARIYAMIRDTGDSFNAISKDGPLIGYGNDFLSVRAVKLFADGALGSRGAAMLKPYSDDPHNSGLLFMSPAVMTAKIEKAFSKGYQVGVHAIGDHANREVLDSYAAAYKVHPDAINLRNRVEHAQIVTLQDIPRFVTLHLIASMQPTHATSDMNMAEARIGHQRMQGAYAWQRFLKQGTVIAAGSDFPVESPNPFYGLYSAVTREDHKGQPPGGWYPQDDLTLVEALRAFTLDAAYAEHAEQTLGTLEPGKWADFIVVDHDVMKDPASKLWNTKVLQTWVGGKQVYVAKD